MRILAISNHSGMLGGGEHSFLDLLSGIAPDICPLAVVPAEGVLAERLRARAIPTVAVPLAPVRPWLAGAVCRSLFRLLAVCRRSKPALVYANGSRAAIYGGIVGKLSRKPVVWHCRISQRDPALDSLLLLLASRVVVNSNSTAWRFAQRNQKKVTVVYNGIPLQWFQRSNTPRPEEIDPDWNVILTVARISRSKRHDLAISAFERVAAVHPRAHLVCVGDKDRDQFGYWRQLQRRSAISEFSRRIHWVGHADDVRPWYHAAAVLFCPAENEGFGRVVVEAMSCGLAVVAAKSGGATEIIRHLKDGWLVPAGRTDLMADALVCLLENPFLRQRLVEAARQRATVFDTPNHIRNMMRVFREAANHAR